MGKKYKILYFRDRCIGCGSCVAVCEKYWEMKEDGLSFLKNSRLQKGAGETTYELDIDAPECNTDAQDVCPVQIIKVKKNEPQ